MPGAPYAKADVAIARAVDAFTTDKGRLARCVALAPDFTIALEGKLLVARWTKPDGTKRGLSVDTKARWNRTMTYDDRPRQNLLEACLFAMLRRTRP